MPKTRYLQLPFSFDIERLQQDLMIANQSDWISHFNTQAYENDWSCIPLRSVGGRSDHILPLDGLPFEDTPILQQCHYFQEVIRQFECEVTSVRLMALAPGGEIKEHRDAGTSLEDGITRLHVPIQSNPQVLFSIDGELVHFSVGNTWYLNASCLHGVRNTSTQNRIHLMLDCVTNAWLENVFLKAGWIQPEPSIYADRSINNENVQQIISALRLGGTETGLLMADNLERSFQQQKRLE
jgi:hypothetical protein